MLLLVLAGGAILIGSVEVRAQQSSAELAAALEKATPGEADAILSKLSDEQVRGLLIAELQKKPALSQEKPPQTRGGLINWLRGWLHVIDDQDEDSGRGISGFLAGASGVSEDLARSLAKIAGGQEFGGSPRNLLLVALIFCVGFGLELVFRKVTARLTSQMAGLDHKSELGLSRTWGAMLQVLPSLVHITVFAFASLGIFILTHTGQIQPARSLFMAILLAIVLARVAILVSTFLCSPDINGLRLLPLQDHAATAVHRSITILAWYIASSLMFISLVVDLGASQATVQFVGVMLGTLLILLVVVILLIKKETIRAAILTVDEGEELSWLRRLFASSWLMISLLYLFGIWLIWLHTILSGTGKGGGTLLISLIIIPLYLLLDCIAQWVIHTGVATLNIFQPPKAKKGSDPTDAQSIADLKKKEVRFKKRMRKGMRVFIGIVLGLWLLSLWGYPVPFAGRMVDATFDILVTLTLALLAWRVISGVIERKLAESHVEEEDEKDEDIDEFGSAKQRGRSYTILPMVRKFIASTLLVMVTLIILSSMGVDIGPLLAGAGVVGLAVGFGAQKMVTDILSGIFYLLDDAFRVGEYIEAGSVKGSVEKITLRNVMLRHHRGMLQIVPHSELGSITNFMRGGLIGKFSLEFPYDTDVNAVRKIIKKVGQQMLEDPELGPDFIKPIKSQGVREIANSVMVIRVKFTAQPGKQFVIQREGIRRITEALAAKGIHYAHRRVIVEVPNLEGKVNPAEADKIKKALEAGAAAGQIALDSGQKPEEKGKAESP